MSGLIAIRDEYTRKVSGETFQYDAHYNLGKQVEWDARVYMHSELKGEPKGSIIDNTMSDAELKQYIIAYIEGIIERGLGIEE